MPKHIEGKKDGWQRYDWNLIKQDYVTDPKATLKSIQKKYDTAWSTIVKHSRQDGWVNAKKEYQAQVRQKAVNKIATREANKLANEMLAADKVSEIILKALTDDDQLYKHVVSESCPAPEGIGVVSVTYDKVMETLNTKSLRDIVASLKTIEDMKRSLYDLQHADQMRKEEREEKRLRLEMERLELEKQRNESNAPDKDVRIVIGGYDEEWTR